MKAFGLGLIAYLPIPFLFARFIYFPTGILVTDVIQSELTQTNIEYRIYNPFYGQVMQILVLLLILNITDMKNQPNQSPDFPGSNSSQRFHQPLNAFIC